MVEQERLDALRHIIKRAVQAMLEFGAGGIPRHLLCVGAAVGKSLGEKDRNPDQPSTRTVQEILGRTVNGKAKRPQPEPSQGGYNLRLSRRDLSRRHRTKPVTQESNTRALILMNDHIDDDGAGRLDDGQKDLFDQTD